MTALDVLTVAMGVALIAVALSIVYQAGRWTALRHLDDQLNAARQLSAYGALLHVESQATGVAIEHLIERDMREARGRLS